ncbi:hypothetical protein [Azospirillum argentinense]
MPGGLDAYIEKANQTTRELLEGEGPLLTTIRRYDEFFRKDLWTHVSVTPEVSSLLQMNAYMGFLAGVRMALSGHSLAVFPLMRVALESACYGLMMARDPALVTIWGARHDSPEHRKVCRNAFTVAKANAYLKGWADDIHQLVADCYEAAIDFGAHPNPIGIMNQVSFDEERSDGNVAVILTGLHGAANGETIRGLVACLDYGLAIIGVILLTPPNPTQLLIDDLSALNDAKNATVASISVC